MPYEVLMWEKLFWFLKFLIPKLVITTIEDPIDALLESIDLSTYGLERTRVNHSIGLDASETELDPQNPNPRGAHNQDNESDELDEIVRTFNDRWFKGWDETPEDQRIRFVRLTEQIMAHPDYKSKVADNQDSQKREIALKKILDDVMRDQRKRELDLYKLYAKDEAFYSAFFNTMKRMLDSKESA